MADKRSFNTAPYFDDFKDSNNFHRILYKPGLAVQARELNQMQTILQSQIERFGQNIFVPGARVLGGQTMVDFFYRYVKVKPGFRTIAQDMVGQTIYGTVSGIKAVVVRFDASPDRLYVKYISSANDFVSKTFQDGEDIVSETTLNSVPVLALNATGFGTAFTILPGVIFAKDQFVYHEEQTIIVEPEIGGEGAIINKKIGFIVSESVVDFEDDPSLLDPALGASNYMAPGADRYVVDLSLKVIGLSEESDDSFVELTAIEDGFIIRDGSFKTEYSVLGDTMARRMYDTNGSFTVRPYDIEIKEHLKSNIAPYQNGYLPSDLGGNTEMFVGIVSPGKAYVMGYEVDSVASRYVFGTKSRTTSSVNNSTIDTVIGNYVILENVSSLPDLISMKRVSIFDGYTASAGLISGNQIGSCRIRGIVPEGGDKYRAYLFDVQINAGSTFDKDAHQLFYNNGGVANFTADIVPMFARVSGTITTAATSNVVIGVGTRFNTEITVGDNITISSGNTFVVSEIVSENILHTVDPVANTITGTNYAINVSTVNSVADKTYLHELPYQYIKSVNSTGTEMNYNVMRVYDRALSSGNVSITANSDETFAPYTISNYLAVDTSSGNIIDLSGAVTRSGSPIGRIVTISVNPAITNIRLIAKIQKSNSRTIAKIKNLIEDQSITLLDKNQCENTSISLLKADCFRLKSVLMSRVEFGQPFDPANVVDITSRYSFDTGQRDTHYDVGSIKLTGIKPTGPIRITFDYFMHSAGDFFSVQSYIGSIGYDSIPSYISGNKTYQLRDCLDFRPVIDPNRIGFSDPMEFLSAGDDLISDYDFYLPRIDKVVLTSKGEFVLVEGVPDMVPKIPATPVNTMHLFTLQQNPYVFDATKDIKIFRIDNRRYTMRDIGKLEGRIRNLEYYVSLSLLERDTITFQVKDALGFDRFKNGIIVDQFSGHNIGDTENPDYSIAMDTVNGHIRPQYDRSFYSLKEKNTLDSERISAHYKRTGNVATLPFTDFVYAKNDATSLTENINPFSVANWVGVLELNPPSDIWYDVTKEPTAYFNVEGNYNSVYNNAVAAGTMGTVWNAWQTTWYGNPWETTVDVNTRTGTNYVMNESIANTVERDVEVSRDVIYKMRSIDIEFHAVGMKPNTRVHAFFDNFRITDFCRGEDGDIGDMRTDATGAVSGTYTYDANFMNLPTGTHYFRVTDSPTNSTDSETSCEAIFETSGTLLHQRDEFTATRNGYVTSEMTYQQTTQYHPPVPYAKPPASYLDSFVTLLTGCAVENGLLPLLENGPSPDPWGEVIARNEDFVYSLHDTLPNGTNPAFNGTLTPSGGFDPNPAHGRIAAANPKNKRFGHLRSVSVNIAQYYSGRYKPGSLFALGYNDLEATAICDGLWHMEAGAFPNIRKWQDFLVYRNQMKSRSRNERFGIDYGYLAPNGSSTPRVCWANDPLAQTFIVSGNPIYLSKIDLFFYDKDLNVPAFLEIRTVENGQPAQKVIPFSRKTITPGEVNISDDGSVSTTIAFDGVVYLEPGEYCIVLLTSSFNYKMWISEVGKTDILTGKNINTQPFVGVLFKSQNASTWTADQLQDLKFILYGAKFDNSVRGRVDIILGPDYTDTKFLEDNPIVLYPGMDIAKVIHKDNGFQDGSYVAINGAYSGNAEVDMDQPDMLWDLDFKTVFDNVQYTVSNVRSDSYTIKLPSIPSNTDRVRVGSRTTLVDQDRTYDSFFPAISVLNPADTRSELMLESFDHGYIRRAGHKLDITTNEFDNTKVIPSMTNRKLHGGNVEPIIVSVYMESDSEFKTPIVDLQQMGAVFISNRINDPSYENNTTGLDDVVIASAPTISIDRLDNAIGLVNLVNAIDKANADTIINGTFMIVSGTGTDNNGRYRVIDVLDAGSNIMISGNVTSQVSGNTITVINNSGFIAEEAAFGGSSRSKYITKQFNFVNPSTSIRLLFDAHKPDATDIKIYYKTMFTGDTGKLADKEYILIDGISIKQASADEFYEIDHQLDDLPQFDSLVIKIVLNSSISSRVPKVSGLRAIILA